MLASPDKMNVMSGVQRPEGVPKNQKRQFLGDMEGTAEILGDIVSPVIDLEEFEAYRNEPPVGETPVQETDEKEF